MGEGGSDGAVATVILVEGESDRLAVETLAARLGVDLAAGRASVVSMGGVNNLRSHLAALALEPVRPRAVGLFDLPEAAHVRRAVEEAGLGPADGDLESLGFFACDPDLEGELIRALGSARVEELLAQHGELARFRGFQQQPAWRAESTEAQLRRFMGTHAGRKARFAPIFVDSLESRRIPAPMASLLAAAVDGG
ncbi:ATP-dependent endonuclease [Agromyces sp. SYSU K20354]|uniref:TOPRIM nucleotidyl transferase/hydrolase domain-containing protein n=1 Tax=Agromyces cavernae TaxID=2898659 RepID=UPI001E571A6F|nr:TOPRIM nucleotidyl transferase/hydrolase domain-containing protein [Agromyces cavernae]MCD2441042.1 ATP-dependent endonuclease [Agromyces cavernae]